MAKIRDPIRSREMDRRTEVVYRRLARAQTRYVQALTALAKLRKLAVPFIINQLNLSGCNRFGYNLDLIDLTLFFPKNHCFS